MDDKSIQLEICTPALKAGTARHMQYQNQKDDDMTEMTEQGTRKCEVIRHDMLALQEHGDIKIPYKSLKRRRLSMIHMFPKSATQC